LPPAPLREWEAKVDLFLLGTHFTDGISFADFKKEFGRTHNEPTVARMRDLRESNTLVEATIQEMQYPPNDT